MSDYLRCLLLAVAIAGCAPQNGPPAPSSTEQSEDAAGGKVHTPNYINCQAVLVDYESDYPWFESSAETGQSHGVSPRALFVISLPTEYAGHNVAMLLRQTTDDPAEAPQSTDSGMTFSFEIPDDFFTGEQRTIDQNVIRNLTRISQPTTGPP